MNARDEIMERIRSALAPAPGASRPPSAQQTPRDYVHARNLPDRVGLFAERVEDYRASVTRTAPAGIAAAIADCLRGIRTVVVPAGFDPAWLPAGLDVVGDESVLSARQLDRVDAVITSAVVGIAVTGTIVLDHTAGQGRRALTLVPDVHVCVITADQVVGDVPEAIGRLATSVAAGRPLTWISGPSATSDIELERVEGVHGPRTLHVVLVEPA